MKLHWLKWMIVWVAMVRGCPEECRCDSRKRVYCNNRNLSELPRNIPADTKVLFLQDNRLTNTIQLEQELARLTKLERLEFFNNNLESIPKLNSINLRELHLSNNRIKTISSDSLSNVSNLSELILDGNNLTNAGINSAAFRNLHQLQRISFMNNLLTEFPVNLPTSLTHVHLSDNQISYISSAALFSLSHVEVLFLNRNRLSDGSFEKGSLTGLDRLVELEVSYNLLNHVPLGVPNTLEKLHMTSNKLEYIRKDEFPNNLRLIDVSYNHLRAIEDGTLEGLGNLDRIDLSGNNWNCDCYLKSLKLFLNDNPVHRGIREPIMCDDFKNAGTLLDHIHHSDLKCDTIQFNVTSNSGGGNGGAVRVQSEDRTGIVPPFGEYVLIASSDGVADTELPIKSLPADIILEQLLPEQDYKICLLNKYDITGSNVPNEYCTTYKIPLDASYVEISKSSSQESVIGLIVGMIIILIVIAVVVLIFLRRRQLALCGSNAEKDIITDASLEKNFRLYQSPNQPFNHSGVNAMTMDASKEFNVTLMLRNPHSHGIHPTIRGQKHHPMNHVTMGSQMIYKSEYNINRDSGIYGNNRNNSLTGSTTTGSEETEKTLLNSSRGDLGIYL